MALDRISAMRTFAAVAQAGSFSAAARRLNISVAAVSRQIAELEREMGVRLLQRTTRRMQLTEVGQAYLQGSERILTQIEELESQVQACAAEPRGLLRILASETLQRPLSSTLLKYHQTYPLVDVEIEMANRPVDMVAEQLDVWLHIVGPIPANHIARPISELPLVLCASPAYLDRHGIPKHPQELTAHRCLNTRLTPDCNPWVFDRTGETCSIPIRADFISNNAEMLRHMVLNGAGIARLTRTYIGDEIASGNLVPVLEDWSARGSPSLSVVYPSARHVPLKVRAFVELLQAHWPS